MNPADPNMPLPQTPLAGDSADQSPAANDQSRWDRYIAAYVWLIAKNVVGWALILASFVIGPLIPGPGGIPMFIIGFALVTLPGKRKLVARIFRGRRFHFWSLRMMLFTMALSIAAPGVAMWLLHERWNWLAHAYARGPGAVLGVYATAVGFAFLLCLAALYLANALVRFTPRMRRKVRPWLRDHRIHLLPPRRRRRQPHEPLPAGKRLAGGPIHLKDEIIAFLKTRRQKRKA